MAVFESQHLKNQALIERFSEGGGGGDEARSQLLLLCVKFLVLHSARLLAAMLAAAVLRRHLMVWKIFAPRSVLEMQLIWVRTPDSGGPSFSPMYIFKF